MIVTDILWMIFLFFVPGIVSFLVYHYVAHYPITKAFKFWTYSAIWGFFDYVVYECLMNHIYDIPFGQYLEIWTVFKYKFSVVTPLNTVYVTILGIALGYIVGKIMCFWKHRHTSDSYARFWKDGCKLKEWAGKQVTIIDYKNDCIYSGEIKSYSYFTDLKEIILENASVKSLQKEQFYDKQPANTSLHNLVYLSLEDTRFCIIIHKDNHSRLTNYMAAFEGFYTSNSK